MVKTYNEIYLAFRRALLDAGVEEAGTEARFLLSAAAGKSVAAFLRDIRLFPSEDFPPRAEDYLRRRLSGEPAAYIAGCWEFHGLELEVNPHTLIPRSDTEVVTDAAIGFLQTKPKAKVLDLCTGSGCIALAIADAVKDCRVIAADIDPAALNTAKRNAVRTRLHQRVFCLPADALNAPPKTLGSFDLIISNPPYIPAAEIETLDASVKDYEPRLALDGGNDGLDFYRSIFRHWVNILNPGGCLALECGEEQAASLIRFGAEVGLTNSVTFRDTGDTERAVLFYK